jgi:hypothetical protein
MVGQCKVTPPKEGINYQQLKPSKPNPNDFCIPSPSHKLGLQEHTQGGPHGVAMQSNSTKVKLARPHVKSCQLQPPPKVFFWQYTTTTQTHCCEANFYGQK